MEKIPVIAVFDIGKTNKKLFLFDEKYQIVYEKSAIFQEILDEDGDPCEDIVSLKTFLLNQLQGVLEHEKYDIKALNFSAYGASLVFLDEEGKPLTPLYNYLKPYPEHLTRQFYESYGGEAEFSHRTASPVLGSLNSGMMAYRLKYEKPEIFKQVRWILHLPQYLSFLVTGKAISDITSIGCHTNLWDFEKNEYHEWVKKEGLLEKLAPIKPADQPITADFFNYTFPVGIGLHDSSAALIPYLVNFDQPFVLISTGTWCISLNPFNHTPLTAYELQHDCLNYIQYEGKPVKASRLFAGYEHEQQVKRIASHFDQPVNFYKAVSYDPEIITSLQDKNSLKNAEVAVKKSTDFAVRELTEFSSAMEAYHQLMLDLVKQQYFSTQLILKGKEIKRIFVDGGFSKNPIFMNLLAAAFPGIEVFAASMAQATALGAALAIHQAWNNSPIPNDIIQLNFYSSSTL